MSAPERPRLRPYLQVARHGDGHVLFDTKRISPGIVPIEQSHIPYLERMTGRRTLEQIHAEVAAEPEYDPIDYEQLQLLTTALSSALLLFDHQFEAYLNGPNRFPVCVGVYPEEPGHIAKHVEALFTRPGGAGWPIEKRTDDNQLRAVLLPHMDYARGNVTYGWGMRAILEQSNAKLFVIVATSHYSPHRFTLTRKNFTTPLGSVPTDQKAIDWISERYGSGLFDDPYAHLPEHSIELEVLLLQQLLKEPFRIVPLLVGSFHDCILDGIDPMTQPDIATMVATLREFDQQCNEEVCYIISGDLAHIGPKFGDTEPVHDEQLQVARQQDEQLLATYAKADFTAYHRIVAEENDSRRICGYPPTWLTLAALTPSSGKSLHYQQYVEPNGHESVSFAAAIFTK